MIGEQFDYGDEICGAVVSVRGKQERIAIWTKNAANEAVQVLFLRYVLLIYLLPADNNHIVFNIIKFKLLHVIAVKYHYVLIMA